MIFKKCKHWDWFAFCPRCHSTHSFMSELDDNVYCADCNYPESRNGPNPLIRESLGHIKHCLDIFLEQEEYREMMNKIHKANEKNRE